jgi:hypothetical protein
MKSVHKVHFLAHFDKGMGKVGRQQLEGNSWKAAVGRQQLEVSSWKWEVTVVGSSTWKGCR